MMRVLVLGRGGQVGRELCACLPAIAEVIAHGRDEVDVSNPQQIRDAVRCARPDVVINATAYTAVDSAETDREAATAINGTAPGLIAEAAGEAGAAVVHYSTDYVFDGNQSTPYTEDDAPNPVGFYAVTKLAGERAVEATRAPHLILRLSGVYSHAPGNFVTTIWNAAKTRDELKVVIDQAGSPTWARTIAQTTAAILKEWRGAEDRRRGVYNLASRGDPTRHALAVAIVDHARARGDTRLTAADVKPIRTVDLPNPGAPRPRYSALSPAKLERDFAVEMPSWDRDLEAYFGAVD